jgi:hypothetical protein
VRARPDRRLRDHDHHDDPPADDDHGTPDHHDLVHAAGQHDDAIPRALALARTDARS